MNMNVLKIYLQKIKEFLLPLLICLKDWCKQAHQKYLKKEKITIKTERELKILMNQKKLREELFDVFSTSSYPKLIAVRTLQNIRPVSYEIQMNKILYYYTIDKEQSGKIALTICKSICENMNNDIVTYGQFLMENYFPEELLIMYPNLWYGVKVLKVTDQETNVKLTVVSNRPL